MKKKHSAAEEASEGNVSEYPDGWKKTLLVAVACTAFSAVVVYFTLSILGRAMVLYQSNECVGHTNVDRWWDTCSLTSTSSLPIGWIVASTLSCVITSLVFTVAVAAIRGNYHISKSQASRSLIHCWRRLFTASYVYTLVLYAVLLPFGVGEPRFSALYITASLVGVAFFLTVVRCGYKELAESNNTL